MRQRGGMKMNTTTTKKSEQVQVVKTAQKKAEVQEEAVVTNPVTTPVTNPIVDTLWNQYEQSLDRARKLRESREEAYLKTVKEVIKFNKEFRKSLSDLYAESRKTNSEIVKGVSSNFAKKDEAKQVTDTPELTKQVKEVTDRLEKLAVTPIKSTFDLIERLEKNVEESSESYVHYARERRKGWQKVTNEYVKVARNNHKMLVNRFEESVKVLVNTK